MSQLSIIEVPSSGAQKTLNLPTGLLPQVSFSPDARKPLISSSSPLRTFYQVTQSGYDQRVSTDVVKQKLEVLRRDRRCRRKAVKELKLRRRSDRSHPLRSVVKARLSLYNLAIVDLLPGGFEVVVNPPQESSDSDEESSDGEESYVTRQRRRKQP